MFVSIQLMTKVKLSKSGFAIGWFLPTYIQYQYHYMLCDTTCQIITEYSENVLLLYKLNLTHFFILLRSEWENLSISGFSFM